MHNKEKNLKMNSKEQNLAQYASPTAIPPQLLFLFL